MSGDDWVKVITAGGAAVASVLVACAGIFVQVRMTHELVNSRMTELLDLTRRASRAEGQLAGHGPVSPPTDPSSASPTV